MHSKETDVTKELKLLEKDLINGPFDCFGHQSCSSPDLCSTAKDRLQQYTSAEGSKEISVKESMEISKEGNSDTLAEGEEYEGANEEADSSDDIGTLGRLGLVITTIGRKTHIGEYVSCEGVCVQQMCDYHSLFKHQLLDLVIHICLVTYRVK